MESPNVRTLATQLVLVPGNKWRGGDQRCIGDQSADNTTLADHKNHG